MSVGATIVVQFGTGADSSAFVAVELDETMNLDAEGKEKTQFAPGDAVWWWLQYDTAALRLGSIGCTSGMVVPSGTASRSRKQELTWTGDEDQELSHIPAGSPALAWYGNVGSGLSVEGRKVSVAGNIPCTADAVIPISVALYRYIPPPMTLVDEQTWRSVIVITLEAA